MLESATSLTIESTPTSKDVMPQPSLQHHALSHTIRKLLLATILVIPAVEMTGKNELHAADKTKLSNPEKKEKVLHETCVEFEGEKVKMAAVVKNDQLHLRIWGRDYPIHCASIHEPIESHLHLTEQIVRNHAHRMKFTPCGNDTEVSATAKASVLLPGMFPPWLAQWFNPTLHGKFRISPTGLRTIAREIRTLEGKEIPEKGSPIEFRAKRISAGKYLSASDNLCSFTLRGQKNGQKKGKRNREKRIASAGKR